MVYRKGGYYFMWSIDDTRSENYQVHYGTSDSPLGKITIPENDLVIIKNKEVDIHGTRHNSVIQIPGTDHWYILSTTVSATLLMGDFTKQRNKQMKKDKISPVVEIMSEV